MAIEITVPRLGWSMEEGRFLGWLKQPGDTVAVGDPLFTLENEKAAQDVEAVDAGVLHVPDGAPQPGDVVPVGGRLGWLLATGEAAPAAGSVPAPAPSEAAPATAAGPASEPTAGPRATPAAAQAAPPASPRARRAAASLGVDLATCTPGGTAGRIRERDVRGLATAGRPAAVPPRDPAAAAIRRTIAERMMTSLANTAPVTLTSRADATNLVALRTQFKAAGSGTAVPAYTDIVAKLAAIALSSHPLLAARWEGDGPVLPDAIHIGIAVDTDHGLVVPVIRDVAGLTLAEITRRSADLVAAARGRRSSPDDLRGGSFTITNLGGYGVDAFTPIINYPETAVLGLGAIRPELVALDEGRAATRDVITLSLTFDHRVVDGGPAARFLQMLRQGIENPAAWLLDAGPRP